MNTLPGLQLTYNHTHCVIHAAVKLGFFYLYGIPYPEKLNCNYAQERKADEGDKGIKYPLIHDAKIDKEVLLCQLINVSLTKFNASLTFHRLITI